MNKLDFIYAFHFNNNIDAVINRLKSSINSIKNQNVNICISNTSKQSIKNYFTDYENIKYFEEEINIEPYCKTMTLNRGIKNLVTTEYFFVSDVDIL
jgi:flavorubredoxin